MAAAPSAREALAARLARDVNACSDANKFTRKRGLTALHAALFDAGEQMPPLDVALAFLQQDVLRALLQTLEDASEAAREASASLLVTSLTSGRAPEGAAATAAYTLALLPALVPIMARRIGRHPAAEESEEIRHSLARACVCLVTAPDAVPLLRANIAQLVDVARACSLDAYHNVKSEAAAMVVQLATRVPDAVRVHASTLAAALLPNVSHQRGPVRTQALHALQSVVPLAAESMTRLLSEQVLPVLRLHARFDRVAAVRGQLATLTCHWLHALPDYVLSHAVGAVPQPAGLPQPAQPQSPALTTLAPVAGSVTVRAHLLALTLALLADEDRDVYQHTYDVLVSACEQLVGHPRVSAAALDAVAPDVAVAAEAASGHEDRMQEDAPTTEVTLHVPVLTSPHILPLPFRDRAPPIVRQVVQSQLRHVLPLLFAEAADWTSRARLAAASALRSLMVCGEAAVTSFLDAIIAALCSGSRDEEPPIRAMFADVGKLLGVFVPPSAQLNVLVPQLAGRVSGLNNTQHYAAALVVLANAVSSMTREQLTPHAAELVDTLRAAHLAEDEPPSLRPNLATAARHIVHILHGTGTPAGAAPRSRERRLSMVDVTVHERTHGADLADADVAYRSALVVLIMHLLDTAASTEVVGTAKEIAQTLRHAWRFESSCALVASVLAHVMPSIVADVQSWTKASANRRVFDTCIRVARPALAGRNAAECSALVNCCLDVFAVTLSPSKDAELRVAMLALLDDFILAGHDPHALDDALGEPAPGAPRVAPLTTVPAGMEHAMDVVPSHTLNPASAASAMPLAHTALATPVHTVTHTTVDAALAHASDRLVRDALLPNAVWRLGLVASTIRKVSIACLLSLLRRRLLPGPHAASVLTETLPVLRSCLSDDDSATRHMTVTLLSHLFSITGRALDFESVRSTYPELLKRLDDSSDAVRIAACATLRAFRHACPIEELRGGPVDFIIEALLVHVDDPQPAVQRAAFECVCAWVSVGVCEPGGAAMRAIQQARTQHRDPTMCDQLLDMIERMHVHAP